MALQILVGESGEGQDDALVERFETLVRGLLPLDCRLTVSPKPGWTTPTPTMEQHLNSFGTASPIGQFRPGVAVLTSSRPPRDQEWRTWRGGLLDPSHPWREELRQAFRRIISPVAGEPAYTQVIRLFSSETRILFGQGPNAAGTSGGIARVETIGGGLDVADFEQLAGRDPAAAAGILIHEMTEQYGIQHDHQDFPTA